MAQNVKYRPRHNRSCTYNGPITGDQTDLTYSFDIPVNGNQILHFVVINTDPSGADATPPANSVAADAPGSQGTRCDQVLRLSPQTQLPRPVRQ